MYRSQLAWVWLALLAYILPSALVVADADFESVRTTMTKDFSGKKGDPKQKYFRMYFNLPIHSKPG